jgi:hypothetical protein
MYISRTWPHGGTHNWHQLVDAKHSLAMCSAQNSLWAGVPRWTALGTCGGQQGSERWTLERATWVLTFGFGHSHEEQWEPDKKHNTLCRDRRPSHVHSLAEAYSPSLLLGRCRGEIRRCRRTREKELFGRHRVHTTCLPAPLPFARRGGRCMYSGVCENVRPPVARCALHSNNDMMKKSTNTRCTRSLSSAFISPRTGVFGSVWCMFSSFITFLGKSFQVHL